jgi:hypothetical protein
MKAVPELFQPPPLVKEVKTWFAGAVGARTQRTEILSAKCSGKVSFSRDDQLTNNYRKESHNVQDQK